MRKLAILVAMTATFGCDNNRNVAVSNSNPKGTVGGVVLEFDGESPLMGATVTLQSAGGTFSGTTDAGGVYSIPGVPAGGFWLTIAATGHQNAYFAGQLNGSVGNFPVSDPVSTIGTVALFKNDKAFSIRLVDQNGAAAAGVECTARVQERYFTYGYSNNNNSNTLVPAGTYAIKATSDMNGLVTFAGMPDLSALSLIATQYQTYQVYIDVPPTKVMGTEEYSFSGASYGVNPSHLSVYNTSTGLYDTQLDVTFVLAGPNTELRVVNSSIDFLRDKSGPGPFGFGAPVGSVLPVDKPIAITFNQAIDAKSLRATLLDENGQTAGVALTPTVNTNLVSLAPASNLAPGKRYNLALHANSLINPAGVGGNTAPPRELNITAPFFTAGPAAVTVTSTLDKTTPNAAVFTLTFSEPVGLGKGAASAVPCVAWYEGGGVVLHTPDVNNPVYPGEYSTASPMVCNIPRVADFATYDVTAIAPQELKNPVSTEILTTGFATVWKVSTSVTASLDNLGCKTTTPMGVNCVRPGQAAGGTTHLLFSRLPGTLTFKRANGQPVADLTVATPN